MPSEPPSTPAYERPHALVEGSVSSTGTDQATQVRLPRYPRLETFAAVLPFPASHRRHRADPTVRPRLSLFGSAIALSAAQALRV